MASLFCSGQFSICQDTQILQTHVSHGRHAYVHYFTLYDLRARGFVRPLCLAYVSSNHLKLHNIFPHLRDQFLKVFLTSIYCLLCILDVCSLTKLNLMNKFLAYNILLQLKLLRFSNLTQYWFPGY